MTKADNLRVYLEVVSVETSLVLGPPLLELSALEEANEIIAEDVLLPVCQAEDTAVHVCGILQFSQ